MTAGVAPVRQSPRLFRPQAESTRATQAGGNFTPVSILEVALEDGLRTLLREGGSTDAGADNRPALVLVRLHTHAIGLVGLNLASTEPARDWPQIVEETLGTAIAEHLLADQLSPPPNFDLWTGRRTTRPICLAPRRHVLQLGRPASVIIATRERTDHLARCLDSLLRLDYPDFEILVVDNDPETDATRSLIADRYAGVNVRYLQESERGLGAAHNRGLLHARGEILAFTDDDVIVDRHWLSALVAPLVARRVNVAGSTGLILPAQLETRAQLLLEAHGRFAKGFVPTYFNLGADRPADSLFPFTAGRLGSGASLAFDANYLRRAGGFDPALGTGTRARGGDDLAAIFQLVASGNTLAYCPDSIVWHHHRREEAALSRQAYGYGVGLGAYLMSVGVSQPRQALSLLTKLPAAASHLVRQTGRTAIEGGELARLLGGTPAWPSDLVRLQRKGILVGPGAYLLSRRDHRRRAGIGSAP